MTKSNAKIDECRGRNLAAIAALGLGALAAVAVLTVGACTAAAPSSIATAPAVAQDGGQDPSGQMIVSVDPSNWLDTSAEAEDAARRSCEAGSAERCFQLGRILDWHENRSAAADAYGAACAAGLAEGCTRFGLRIEGTGRKEESVRALRAGCDGGDRTACINLRIRSFSFIGLMACEDGDGRGCVMLGQSFLRSGDRQGALDAFRRACELGVEIACEAAANL